MVANWIDLSLPDGRDNRKGCAMMFFCGEESLKKKKALQAVAKDCSGSSTGSRYQNQISFRKRISWRTSLKPKGSMTVEAALVFPLFLFGLTALLYLFVLLRVQTEIGRALADAGRELSQDADVIEGMENSALAGVIGGQKVREYLSRRPGIEVIRQGVNGISMLGTTWNAEDSMLTLRVSYQVVLPPDLKWFHPIFITQTKTVRGWTGFGKRQSLPGDQGEEVVYVTDYGTVYHRRLNCRHLKLTIKQVSAAQVDGLRNENGGRYTPCERCFKGGGQVVYITSVGNRYHESLNCSGLVRGIRTVLISETGGLPPCSVCGG